MEVITILDAIIASAVAGAICGVFLAFLIHLHKK